MLGLFAPPWVLNSRHRGNSVVAINSVDFNSDRGGYSEEDAQMNLLRTIVPILYAHLNLWHTLRLILVIDLGDFRCNQWIQTIHESRN